MGGGGWWVTTVLETLGLAALLSWVFWVIFSICLHELGHGWAAIRHGDRTPIETGHMTWNPLVHMGQMSLLMFALVGIAWGAMPVSPRRMRGRHAEAAVAAAGPAINVGLFGVSMVIAALISRYAQVTGVPEFDEILKPGRFWINAYEFFRVGAILNVALFALNMLPVMPLDGGRITAHFFPAYRRLWTHPWAGLLMIGGLVAVFYFAGSLLIPLRDLTDGAIDGLAGLLP